MLDEKMEFAKALKDFINLSLAHHGQEAEYCTDAVEIVDARNHIFRLVPNTGTDEELNRFAMQGLCRLDEWTLKLTPDIQRLLAVAKDFFD